MAASIVDGEPRNYDAIAPAARRDRASPGGITELARGAGVFVGERRAGR
jgi:hypothetical protein